MSDFIADILHFFATIFGFNENNNSTKKQIKQPEPTATQARKIKESAPEPKLKKIDHKIMTKKELLATAKSRGVKANASMNKAEIAKAINDAR